MQHNRQKIAVYIFTLLYISVFYLLVFGLYVYVKKLNNLPRFIHIILNTACFHGNRAINRLQHPIDCSQVD